MIFAAIGMMFMQVQSLPPAEAEERLVSWAISDFEANSPGRALDFRAVHMGWLQHPEGVVRPLLCGEVQVASASGSISWVRFATLETRSGYEQWLGGSAATWCNEGTERDLGRDLSLRFEEALVRPE